MERGNALDRTVYCLFCPHRRWHMVLYVLKWKKAMYIDKCFIFYSKKKKRQSINQ